MITVISCVVAVVIVIVALIALYKGSDRLTKIVDAALIIIEKALASEDATELKDKVREGYLNKEYNEALKQILDELIDLRKKDSVK